MAKTMPLTEVANEFANFIAEQIDTYEKELEVNLDKTLEECANDFAEKLKPVTPKIDKTNSKYGHLVDNINVLKRTRKGVKLFEVNFGKKGWLSTLLEYGWEARNGRLIRTNQPFVRPLWEANREIYFNKIKNDIQNQTGGG